MVLARQSSFQISRRIAAWVLRWLTDTTNVTRRPRREFLSEKNRKFLRNQTQQTIPVPHTHIVVWPRSGAAYHPRALPSSPQTKAQVARAPPEPGEIRAQSSSRRSGQHRAAHGGASQSAVSDSDRRRCVCRTANQKRERHEQHSTSDFSHHCFYFFTEGCEDVGLLSC